MYITRTFFYLVLPATVISGCASPLSSLPIDQRSAICATISEQIIMNDDVTNPPSPPNGLPYTPATNANLYKQYDLYHCDEIRIRNSATPGPIIPTM